MKTIFPPKLTKEKLIGFIAPADPVAGVIPDEDFERGITYLKDKGFGVVLGESVKLRTEKYTAGTIKTRVEDIHNFIKRDDIGCLMAFWGGYNSNQLLEELDYDLIKKNPKIIIGYSDITALTTAITTKTGLVTFSGPGGISFVKPDPFDYTWEYFEKTCITPQEELFVKPSLKYADDLYFLHDDPSRRIIKENSGIKTFRKGQAEGEVLVGNLQTLLALSCTEYLPDVKGKIMFIEEDETCNPPLFDRILRRCKHLGWFNDISGLVIGRFTEQSKFSEVNPLGETLAEYFDDVKFPVLYNVDFGHSDPMITIPNGGHAKINADNKEIIFKKSVD